MGARFKLTRSGECEDILTARGMRNAQDSFMPGLQEVGRRFGVSIEFLPESGFDLEYTVKPPVPTNRIEAFAGLVTAIAVDSLTGSFPDVHFMHQTSPDAREQVVFTSLDLVKA